MLMIVPIMMVANRIDFSDPTYLMAVRVAYVSTQIVMLIMCYVTYTSIQKQNNQKKIKVPPPPGLGQPNTIEIKTIKEYDISKLKQYAQELLVQMAIIGFIHLKWEFVPPLFLQTVLNPIRFFKTKIIQVHIFGKTGPELERPFPEEPNPLASLFGQPSEGEAAQQSQEEQAQPSIQEIPDSEQKSKSAQDSKREKPNRSKDKEKSKESKEVKTKKALSSLQNNTKLTNDEVPNDLRLLD